MKPIVPDTAIRERLAAAGFTVVPENIAGTEEVYIRPHDRDPRYAVLVYTSISRQPGVSLEPTINVVAVIKDGLPLLKTLLKTTRVQRRGDTGEVLDRVIERAREAYNACNQHRRDSRKGAAQ